jgi:tetratricopeptide (TPR) repeat protein
MQAEALAGELDRLHDALAMTLLRSALELTGSLPRVVGATPEARRMAVVALDPRILECARTIGDMSTPVSEFDVRRILRDLEEMVDRLEHDHAALVYILMGQCFQRLDRSEKALLQYKLALQRAPAGSTMQSDALNNRGVIFMEMGQWKEAADSLAEAIRIDGPSVATPLSNLAELLDRIGEREQALETYRAAISRADLSEKKTCFGMANQAAELRLDSEAVELFARFLALNSGKDLGEQPAVDFIRAASPEHLGRLNEMPALHRVVRQMSSMADEIVRLACEHPAQTENKGAEAEARDVFEATRHLRDAAVAQVLTVQADEQA